MNTANLLKLAPTLILIAFLAYSSYSLHGSLPTRTSGAADLTKGLDMMVKICWHPARPRPSG